MKLGGVVYPTVEHAYAAAKTLDPVWRKRVLTAKHAGQAKRFGREAPLRADWDEIRLDVMREFMVNTFSILDAVFYGVALVLAYNIAFRDVRPPPVEAVPV